LFNCFSFFISFLKEWGPPGFGCDFNFLWARCLNFYFDRPQQDLYYGTAYVFAFWQDMTGVHKSFHKNNPPASNILGFSSLIKFYNLLNKHVNTLYLLGGVMQRHLKITGEAYLWILAVDSCLSVQHKNVSVFYNVIRLELLGSWMGGTCRWEGKNNKFMVRYTGKLYANGNEVSDSGKRKRKII